MKLAILTLIIGIFIGIGIGVKDTKTMAEEAIVVAYNEGRMSVILEAIE